MHFKSSDNQIHEFTYTSASTPDKEYTNAIEEISADDQMNSSNNERYFKQYLYDKSHHQYEGRQEAIGTGDAPFNGFSILPNEPGSSMLTVKNNTNTDVVLLYFGSNHPIVKSQSRLCSVYIKAGGSYTFRFQPNFERINFWFGKKWIRLNQGVD